MKISIQTKPFFILEVWGEGREKAPKTKKQFTTRYYQRLVSYRAQDRDIKMKIQWIGRNNYNTWIKEKKGRHKCNKSEINLHLCGLCAPTTEVSNKNGMKYKHKRVLETRQQAKSM